MVRRKQPDAAKTRPRLLFMKATLEFNLPQDDEALTDARKGSDWKWAVRDLFNYLKSETKHADHSAEEYRILEAVQERLFEILDDRGLNLYE
jgi:hypothetical protein